jgi:uncharacterized membrane protein
MNRSPFLLPGILLGIGMGGFLDGIVFHQIMQTHSMLSAKLPQDNIVNVKTSMVWDGLFHLFTWIATAIGLALMWKATRKKINNWAASGFWGCLLTGWGMFNFVEGLIDHYALNIHHVVERESLSIYDHLYLFSGLIFIIGGTLLIRLAPQITVAPEVEHSVRR